MRLQPKLVCLLRQMPGLSGPGSLRLRVFVRLKIAWSTALDADHVAQFLDRSGALVQCGTLFVIEFDLDDLF